MVFHNMNGPVRDRVMKLIEEKDRIESDIRDNTAILESNNIGMHEPLIDSDGYPRNDIDVYKVRHARHQIICLQNDHKAIMRRIEQGLTEVHSQFVGPNGEGPSVNGDTSPTYLNGHVSTATSSTPPNGIERIEKFAKCTFVHDNSPAHIAGLCAGDEILQFGSINHENFVDMPQIYNLVSHSVGQRIQVKVKRSDNILILTVIPRPWAQPGLLGCQIQRCENL